ncbi:hypothetical protein OSJ14_25515, partial [Mycobacterium ulcerans]
MSPEDPADNVFLQIGPLNDHQYSYDIPKDQPAGWDCRGKGVSGLIGPVVSGPERSHDDQDCRGCAA